MSEVKIYPKGLRTFKPHDNAPDFVKGTLLITPNELIEWLKDNSQYLTDYKGAKQLKCQILDGKDGLYFQVDTWKKDEGSTPASSQETNDPPF